MTKPKGSFKGNEGPPPAVDAPPADKGRARVHMAWEGTTAEARAFGRFTKRLVSDFQDDPDRRHALKLRGLWRDAATEAGVADA